jgi:hypothetical protein
MIDLPRSTRFGRGSYGEGASGDSARVGVEAGVQVVGLSLWVSSSLFGFGWGLLGAGACLLGAYVVVITPPCLFVSPFHILPLPWLWPSD